MALPIVFNNTSYAAGFVGQDDGPPAASFGYDETSGSTIIVNGQVTGVGSSVQATGIFPGDDASTTKTLYATQYDNSTQILFSDQAGPVYTNANRYVFSNTDISNDLGFRADNNGTLGDYTVCFVTGTRIRVLRNGREAEVAVEDLRVGDLAVTSSGAHRPIRWIGSRTLDPRRHPRPDEAMPVRIHAGAIGEGRPARDLVVSPGHAICLDLLGEVLIPAAALVNGSTVVQDEVDSVTYWHVELDSHDIILAEGQPAESYLDMGNRSFFARNLGDAPIAGATVIDLAALPDADPSDPALRTHADFCRPFHGGGPVVAFVRDRLQERAAAQGWRLSDADPWAGVHLLADGVRVMPEVRGPAAHFAVPAGARDVWLVSPSASPNSLNINADDRLLGLYLAELRIGAGWDARTVALDHPLLCAGFHGVEGHPGTLRRWTAGRARLPVALWADAGLGADRTLMLRLDAGNPALPRWVRPAEAEDAPEGQANGKLVTAA